MSSLKDDPRERARVIVMEWRQRENPGETSAYGDLERRIAEALTAPPPAVNGPTSGNIKPANAVGRTVAAYAEDDDVDGMRFTDGTWCAWEAFDDGDVYLKHPYTISRRHQVALGLIDKAAYEAEEKAAEEKYHAAEAKQRREEYEKLKKEFEGEGGAK